jgi:hypothetical protein
MEDPKVLLLYTDTAPSRRQQVLICGKSREFDHFVLKSAPEWDIFMAVG